jgi:transcription elongation factor GreA
MGDPITKRGYKKLQERLDYLQNTELPKQERALGEAREKGDLSENAEYDAAREHVWEVERQISELKTLMMDLEPSDPPEKPDKVLFGTRVKLMNETRKKEETYEIVGKGENDIMLDRISWASPIAQGLLGSKVGDVVEVNVPAGKMKYKILKIEPIKEE